MELPDTGDSEPQLTVVRLTYWIMMTETERKRKCFKWLFRPPLLIAAFSAREAVVPGQLCRDPGATRAASAHSAPAYWDISNFFC